MWNVVVDVKERALAVTWTWMLSITNRPWETSWGGEKWMSEPAASDVMSVMLGSSPIALHRDFSHLQLPQLI